MTKYLVVAARAAAKFVKNIQSSVSRCSPLIRPLKAAYRHMVAWSRVDRTDKRANALHNIGDTRLVTDTSLSCRLQLIKYPLVREVPNNLVDFLKSISNTSCIEL